MHCPLCHDKMKYHRQKQNGNWFKCSDCVLVYRPNGLRKRDVFGIKRYTKIKTWLLGSKVSPHIEIHSDEIFQRMLTLKAFW